MIVREIPSCPICGGQTGALWISGSDLLTGMPGIFNFIACQGCGLRRLHPRPADMTPYYPESYEFFLTYERRLRSPVRRLARWYGLYKRTRIVIQASGRTQGSVLDVGCASGAFLLAMRNRGWSVQGVEPSAAAVAIARAHGLQIHHSVLETAALTPGQFDVLTLWDVLEHVPEPLDTLRTAAALLKPGGVVIIRIPNPNGLDARLFGRYWTGLDIPRHLWLFTWEQTQLLLAKAGFVPVRRRWDYTPFQLWRFSAEFWLHDHAPPLLTRVLQSMLRSPFTQLLTWPFFQTIARTDLNAMLVVTAYRPHAMNNCGSAPTV